MGWSSQKKAVPVSSGMNLELQHPTHRCTGTVPIKCQHAANFGRVRKKPSHRVPEKTNRQVNEKETTPDKTQRGDTIKLNKIVTDDEGEKAAEKPVWVHLR
jgi:hypothetical protein